MPKRCALGCPFVSGRPYHQFPHAVKNSDRFKAWVCIAGGKLDSQDEIELYMKKVLCDIHFTDKDKNRNNRLNCLAVPTLYLDGKADEVDSAEKEVRFNVLSEVQNGLAPLPEEVQSTSKQDLVDSAENSKNGLSDHKASEEKTQVFKSDPILDLPSESNPYLTVQCPDRIHYDNLKEHNYYAKDKTDITKDGESKYHQPVPPLIVNQLQTARKKVKQLQSEIIRLRKRNKLVATRLINAKQNSKHNCFQKITQNMTAAAKIFTHIQFTQTQKRNAGRRFTLEGQQLSLSIYKSSPQCYDLLSKLFTLPSPKTLKRFRKQFNIQPGLNNTLDEGAIQPGTF